MNDSPSLSISRILWACSLTLALAVFAMLIRVSIAAEPLWLDELHTAWAVKDGFWHIGPRVAIGNQSPLFFWLTWLPVHVFGGSEHPVRAISLLSGVLILALSAAWVWNASRSLAAVVVTSTLICLDWRFVFYATEARPYALLQCLAVVQAWLFVTVIGRCPEDRGLTIKDNSCWIGLAVVSVLLVYCHYTCVWLFGAEAIAFGLLLVRRRAVVKRSADANSVDHVADAASISASDVPPTVLPKSRATDMAHLIRPLLLVSAMVAVACLPLLPNVAMVAQRSGNWSPVSDPVGLWQTIREPFLLWICLPAVVAVVLHCANWLNHRKWRKVSANCNCNSILLLLVALWAAIPIAGPLLADWCRVAPLALFRYTTIGTPALAIASGIVVGIIQWPASIAKKENTCRLFETQGLEGVNNPGLKPRAMRCRAFGAIHSVPGTASKTTASRTCRWGTAILVVGVFLANNDIARQLVRHGSVPYLRSESWGQPIRRIENEVNKQFQPVFLFGNVLEDVAAFSNDDCDFQDYLRFPVAGFNSIEAGLLRTIHACPTSTSPHFRSEHFGQLAKARGGWVIIRAGDVSIREILAELHQGIQAELNRSGSPKEILIDPISEPSNDVQLFSIDLR